MGGCCQFLNCQVAASRMVIGCSLNPLSTFYLYSLAGAIEGGCKNVFSMSGKKGGRIVKWEEKT